VTFGKELQRLREAAGLTIEEIMAETKISRRILESLEYGRFQYLPERVFSRNFVRQYARLIGFDEEKTLEWFDEAWKRFELASGSFHAVEIDVETPSPPIRWHFWIPAGLAVLIITVVIVLIGGGKPEALDLPPDPRRALSTVQTPTLTPTGIPLSSADSPVGTDAMNDVGQAVELSVTVEDSRECWLHFRDGDGRTGERLLTHGASVSLELTGPAVVTIGNAGAVVLETSGESYSQLGAFGEVVHFEVSTKGIRRLSRGPAPDVQEPTF
jgi:cytoskeletal protein RodZ